MSQTTTPPPKPKTLLEALLAAQQQIKTVAKDGKNPHFNSKFATLKEIWESVRPILNDLDLVVYCTTERTPDGRHDLITHIAHVPTGEEKVCGFPITATANMSPQAIGSAISYARRYSLSALLEVIADDEDDDGNAATAAANKRASTPNF